MILYILKTVINIKKKKKNDGTEKSAALEIEGWAKMTGITSYSFYVPRYRINQKTIIEAMGWLNYITLPAEKESQARTYP